jgi:hypothetical protein
MPIFIHTAGGGAGALSSSQESGSCGSITPPPQACTPTPPPTLCCAPVQPPVVVLAHCPVVRHLTVAAPEYPVAQMAGQSNPISESAQAGQAPLAMDAVGAAKHLVGTAEQQAATHRTVV